MPRSTCWMIFCWTGFLNTSRMETTLMGSPENYEPLFLERVVKGKRYMVVDEWCYGFMSGVSLAAHAWDAAGEEMTALLEPILRFADEAGWEELEDMEDEEIERLPRCIKPNVCKIH